MGFEPTTFSLGSNQSRFDKARNSCEIGYIDNLPFASLALVCTRFYPVTGRLPVTPGSMSCRQGVGGVAVPKIPISPKLPRRYDLAYPLRALRPHLPRASNVPTASNVNVAGSGITDNVPLL